MLGLDQISLRPETRHVLSRIADSMSSNERSRLEADLPALAAAARRISWHWDFDAPSQVFDDWLVEEAEHDRQRLKRVLVARLLLEHFAVEDRVPGCVAELYPGFFERLAQFLRDTLETAYDQDYFAKDVRYALGLTVPAGVLSIDLRYRIGPKIVLRAAARGEPAGLVAYCRWRGWARWYNDHLDLRDREGFNPAGWTECFVRLARMLEINPGAHGVVGVSWFYDPAVTEISPRLAYLRRTQVENGAFLVRMEPSEEHTRNATATSAARRKLVEDGHYTPTGYLIAWPRARLIDWARRLKDDPRLAFA